VTILVGILCFIAGFALAAWIFNPKEYEKRIDEFLEESDAESKEDCNGR